MSLPPENQCLFFEIQRLFFLCETGKMAWIFVKTQKENPNRSGKLLDCISLHFVWYLLSLGCKTSGVCRLEIAHMLRSNPCFDSQGNLQSPPCEVKRSNYLSQESWLGSDTTCVTENSGSMPIWHPFFTFFVWKNFERNHGKNLGKNGGYHMIFRYSCPWFEETHLSSRCQAAWELPHQCKQHGVGQWNPEKLSSCGSWRIPLGAPKKICTILSRGNRDSYCVYLSVSSIQEAKLVCNVFVFFFEMLVCNHSLTSIKLEDSEDINENFQRLQWVTTLEANTGCPHWKINQLEKSTSDGFAGENTYLWKHFLMQTYKPPFKPYISFLLSKNSTSKNLQKKTDRFSSGFFFPTIFWAPPLWAGCVAPKAPPLRGIILVSLDSAISRGYIH